MPKSSLAVLPEPQTRLKANQGEATWTRMITSRLLRRKSCGDKFNGDGETENQGIAGMPSEIPCSSTAQHAAKPPKVSGEVPIHGQSVGVRGQSINSRDYRIFVGTWNVAGRSASEDLDLEEWLNTATESADIYVLGFQEIVPLKAGNVFGSEDTGPATKWDALIRTTLNRTPRAGHRWMVRSSSDPLRNCLREESYGDPRSSSKMADIITSFSLPNIVAKLAESAGSECSDGESYKRIASKQMVGIFITVWAKSSLRRHILDLSVSCVGCGIMGCLGNKGSVSVSLSLRGTTFCFVCTHLASGEKKGDELRRNSDVAEILKRTHFPCFPQTIMQHQRIIWFGDLNYRLTLSENEAMSLIRKRDWKSLQETDQLKLEQTAGRIFDGWSEGNIDFAPTYKYAANSDEYCAIQVIRPGGKRRVPAWCDRILWHGKGLHQLSYSRTETRFSDHRAVFALFSTRIDLLRRQNLENAEEFSMELAEQAEDFLSGEPYHHEVIDPYALKQCTIFHDDIPENSPTSDKIISYSNGDNVEDALPLLGFQSRHAAKFYLGENFRVFRTTFQIVVLLISHKALG